MKRKGFTLVELLAVIVVLAVISIITIPMIGNVIEESKKKALEQSVNGLVEAARYYSIENDGTYEFLFDENKKGETINGKKLSYNGSINAEGKLYLDNNGNISICVYNDKYYAYKNYNSGIVIGNRSEDNCDIGYDVISNKYIAFLESEGMNNNIYSKDEVNNLIASVDSKVTTNKNEITNIKSTIETLQNSLNDYALQSSLNTTNSNLESLSSVVGRHTEAIDNLNSNFNNFGNWTPTIEHGTINDSECQYYKIGKLVTLFCAIWGSGDGTDNTVALSLPFQAISFRAYGSVGYFPGAVNYPNLHVIIANENKLMFEYSGGDDVKHINGKQWGTCQFSITYLTN